MPILREVECKNCKKKFFRDKGHVNENLKLGHNFYCSRSCEYRNKTTAKTLICENCSKDFIRGLKDISRHNYCSRSCAATVNNQKFPKRELGYKICNNPKCNRDFRGRKKYCSSECSAWKRKYYTPELMLNTVRMACKALGRAPVKREFVEMDKAYRKHFGSWNNLLISAGLIPHRSHDHRMYKRVNTKAADGHLCDSISEAIIDNWLTKHGIVHVRGSRYPGANFLADWTIGDTFVEYFGLAKDSPRYDREVKRKRRFCLRKDIKLIEIYPIDLYPKISLENKLNLFKGP